MQQRAVDFNLDAKIEKKLRKAGASDEIIQDIYKASPAGAAARKSILTSATGVQLEASPEEAQGLQTIVGEIDPDRRLRMVSEFEKQFPNSKILSYVYTQAAFAYQEKGDFKNAAAAGEKSLKLEGNNLSSLLVVASSLTQPAMVAGSEIEKNTTLSEAQTDANQALTLIAGIPRRLPTRQTIRRRSARMRWLRTRITRWEWSACSRKSPSPQRKNSRRPSVSLRNRQRSITIGSPTLSPTMERPATPSTPSPRLQKLEKAR